MIISHIGNRAVSLYITEAELKEKNLTIETINQDQVQALLNLALQESRLDGWEAAELEVFPGKDALLLFARRKSGKARHVLFANFESLVTAAHLCADELPSALSQTPAGYILTVYPFEGDVLPAVFDEYGTEIPGCNYLAEHYAEQGDTICNSRALRMIKSYFVPMRNTNTL